MLEKILGSKSKIKILRTLFGNLERDFSMEDIVNITGMSYGTVHPSIKDLADSRIIVTRKIGRSKIYNINQKHVIFTQLKGLLQTEASIFKDKAQEFSESIKKDGIENIILFGSVARGEVIDAGDIDLLIIYTNPKIKPPIQELSGKFLEEYDIVISPIFLTKKEVKECLRKFDDFILRVLDEGIILYGDGVWLRK